MHSVACACYWGCVRVWGFRVGYFVVLVVSVLRFGEGGLLWVKVGFWGVGWVECCWFWVGLLRLGFELVVWFDIVVA